MHKATKFTSILHSLLRAAFRGDREPSIQWHPSGHSSSVSGRVSRGEPASSGAHSSMCNRNHRAPSRQTFRVRFSNLHIFLFLPRIYFPNPHHIHHTNDICSENLNCHRHRDELWSVYEQGTAACLDCGLLKEGDALARQSAIRFPRSLRVKVTLGRVLEAYGNYAEADELYDSIIKVCPTKFACAVFLLAPYELYSGFM